MSSLASSKEIFANLATSSFSGLLLEATPLMARFVCLDGATGGPSSDDDASDADGGGCCSDDTKRLVYGKEYRILANDEIEKLSTVVQHMVVDSTAVARNECRLIIVNTHHVWSSFHKKIELFEFLSSYEILVFEFCSGRIQDVL